MKIGGIYYTDNKLNSLLMESCQNQLRSAFDEDKIISVSLKPLNFGRNIVLKNRVRSYPTMATQILMALEASDADYVFYLEHDVLYHPSHFDFTPPTDDLYYYNINNWRWWFGHTTAITYDGLTSLSSLCCNRELAIRHYKYRLQKIEEWGLDKIRSREPRWARKFGYEPGTKKRRNGGITNEDHVKVKSAFPNIDIRHTGTFSHPKISLKNFKHKPTNWKEIPIGEIPGWDLRKLFNL